MVRIINFGSLNIDHVYRVDHIFRPGETIASEDYSLFPGGKGANQSVAIARAGGAVVHVGHIGQDGMWMVENMKNDGVDTRRIMVSNRPSGHAIIQVDKNGQNAIVIHGGTNREISTDDIDQALAEATGDDWVLAQNEINNIPYIIKEAARLNLRICLNPAPMGPEVFKYPLDLVSTFIINQSEGEMLTQSTQPGPIVAAMRQRFPKALVILTLGPKGVAYSSTEESGEVAGRKVTAVDTTGAGDTFVGYFLAGLQKKMKLAEAIDFGNRAASICVTRKGAASSIPLARELQ